MLFGQSQVFNYVVLWYAFIFRVSFFPKVIILWGLIIFLTYAPVKPGYSQNFYKNYADLSESL